MSLSKGACGASWVRAARFDAPWWAVSMLRAACRRGLFLTPCSRRIWQSGGFAGRIRAVQAVIGLLGAWIGQSRPSVVFSPTGCEYPQTKCTARTARRQAGLVPVNADFGTRQAGGQGHNLRRPAGDHHVLAGGGRFLERRHHVQHVVRQLAAGPVRAAFADCARHVGHAQAAAVLGVAVGQRHVAPLASFASRRRTGPPKVFGSGTLSEPSEP